MAKNKKYRKKKPVFNAGVYKIKSDKVLDNVIKKSLLLFRQGKVREALDISQRALVRFPANIILLKNVAVFAAMVGELELAEECTLQSMEITPKSAALHDNLGLILGMKERLNDAETHHRIALKIDPAHINLGSLLTRTKRFAEAKIHYQIGLDLNPNRADIYNNLGRMHADQKNFIEAGVNYQMALKLDPNYIDAKFNLSLLYLNLEDFDSGWQLYESRLHRTAEENLAIPAKFHALQYKGEELADKTLFIWMEQGIGDEVMFASVLPELANSEANITLVCNSRLVNLFSRSFEFLSTVAKNSEDHYPGIEGVSGYHLAVGSLPGFYRTNIHDFDKYGPYLKVDEGLLSKWKNRFSTLRHDICVGISWFGGKNAEQQSERSMPLKDWLPILDQINNSANIVSLQYGECQSAINEIEKQTSIHIYDWLDADPLSDLDNFAAQIKALDLVVCIDNSTAHFSAALGIDTFILLPFNQDWRWAEERCESYWYPEVVRLFRQTGHGDWGGVVAEVAKALSGFPSVSW